MKDVFYQQYTWQAYLAARVTGLGKLLGDVNK